MLTSILAIEKIPLGNGLRYSHPTCENPNCEPEPLNWKTIVSIVVPLLIVICVVGFIIYKKFECFQRNSQPQKSQSKTIKSRENSERSYELPYSVDVYNEYEEYDEGLYEQYQK